MQSKTLHDSINNPTLRWRIRAQALVHAAEESEKLAYHNVNYGRAVVPGLRQARAVDHNVVVAHYICRNVITDHELQQTKVFLIQLPHQITLIGSDGGIG